MPQAIRVSDVQLDYLTGGKAGTPRKRYQGECVSIVAFMMSIRSHWMDTRSQSDLGNRSERMANRGQIFGNLKANGMPIRREFPEILTHLPFSQ